jgi:hypothetical protein
MFVLSLTTGRIFTVNFSFFATILFYLMIFRLFFTLIVFFSVSDLFDSDRESQDNIEDALIIQTFK